MIKFILVSILIVLAWIVFLAFENWLNHSSLSSRNAIVNYSVESDFEEFKEDFMMVDWDVCNRSDLHLRRNNNYVLKNLFIIDGIAYKLDFADFIMAKKFVSDYVEGMY